MSVWNDVRLAVRMLLRDRSFTLTAASALALGIAANSLVFTLVNGVLLREPVRTVTAYAVSQRTHPRSACEWRSAPGVTISGGW